MLAEIPGKVPEGSNADTLLGSGGFRCRYLLRFWRVPVQIPGQLLEGSCADTCWGSWPWFLYHCATPLHACMCMIVYKAEAFKLLGIAPEFIFTPMDLPWTNGWPNHDQKSRSRNSESCPKFTKPSSVVLEMSASSWAGDGTYGRPWPIWGFLSHGGSPVVTMVVHPFMVIPHVCFEFPKTPNADLTSNWIPQSNISSGQCLCYRWWTLISQLFLFWCAVPWIPWRFRGPPSPVRLVVVDNAAVLHTVRTRYKRTDIYTFATTSGPQNGP